MTVTAQAWFMSSGVRRELNLTEPPACGAPGDPQPRCTTRVRWVATSLVNPTGLPGMATEMSAFSCAQHMDRIAEAIGEFAVSGVTFTAYGR